VAHLLQKSGFEGKAEVADLGESWHDLYKFYYLCHGCQPELEVHNKNPNAEFVVKHNLHTSYEWKSRSALDGAPSHTTNTILMVAPIGFQTNIETLQDNYFMHTTADDASEVERKALEEFSALHMKFRNAGIHVYLCCAERFNKTPDAVFPNNWFSTHPTSEAGVSTLVLYPMKTPSRRAERRQNVISELQQVYEREFNFTDWEHADFPQFFESTGVLIMDRIRKIAYCNISERCSEKIAREWGRRMNYEMVLFTSVDKQGRGVYHTNVMMSVGTTVAVVCLDSLPNPTQRENLKQKLMKHHTVVEISLDQMNNFCGNILELQGADKKRYMAMSTTAYNNFTEEQRKVLLQHVTDIIHSPIPTIETIGGGSVRCMMGELL